MKMGLNFLAILAALLVCPALRGQSAAGYVNVPLPPGYSLVGVPLLNETATIAEIFAERPAGTRLYQFQNGQIIEIPLGSQRVPLPGEAFIVVNPSSSTGTAMFVGQVPQGTLVHSLPAGLSLISPMIPMEGTLEEMAFHPEHLDQVYLLDPATGQYTVHTYVEFLEGWFPSAPRLRVGEGFFIRRARPRDWILEFNIIDGVILSD